MHAIKIVFLLAKMIQQKKIMAANFLKLGENKHKTKPDFRNILSPKQQKFKEKHT